MYLLKLWYQPNKCPIMAHSHSTMYLLKLCLFHIHLQRVWLFTFHHVSIKTNSAKITILEVKKFTFHHVSIKTLISALCQLESKWFTFHHVSIKTRDERMMYHYENNSHSTMYLLKLWRCILTLSYTRIHIPPCIY